MSKFVTGCSEHSKKAVTKAWAIGVFGTLGLHFFKVGRIKHGAARLLFGLFMWGILIFGIWPDANIATPGKVLMTLFLFVPSVVDRFKLYMGTFKDNIGNYVREP